MSSWYVFSAMGFYPVSPGRPAYEIGSPLFEETRIRLENGKIFTIKAENVSAQNKYIQSATLNGKTWDKPWFAHSDLNSGGMLVSPYYGTQAESELGQHDWGGIAFHV
jgi:putative alpha-1,2-mannosidase